MALEFLYASLHRTLEFRPDMLGRSGSTYPGFEYLFIQRRGPTGAQRCGARFVIFRLTLGLEPHCGKYTITSLGVCGQERRRIRVLFACPAYCAFCARFLLPMPVRFQAAAAAFAAALCAPLAAQSFEEIADAAGVRFRHTASKTADKYLVETMGAGAALLDYDGDGLLDIYFVNGADLAAPARLDGGAKRSPRYWNRLYRNLGGLRFEDVTQKAGVRGSGYGMGVAAADYDNDGDTDIFVSNFGPDTLLRNEGGGVFRDVSREAGIGGGGWSSGAAFLDYDNDGRLDLFVASYLDWSFARNRPCGDALPARRSYCHPRLFGAVAHTLYRNAGGGRFEDVSARSGIAAFPGKGLGVAVGDYDEDGRIDVFVANDSYPQQLFRNVGGGRFEDVAVEAGIAYDAEGRDYAGMGVAWSDYDGDGRADILVNALGRQGYWLYRNTGGAFEAASERTGLAALSELRSGWGMGLVDFDNDGWRDLFVAQGHVMDDIAFSDPALARREPLLLARNLFGRFFDVSRRGGKIFERRQAARGAAFGDLDNDGRIDIVVNVNDGPALVLRNTTPGAGRRLRIRLEGVESNRDAIGAAVTLRVAEGVRLTAFRGSGGSYLSSSAADLHFGLGRRDCCQALEVRWPDGSRQSIPGPHGSALAIRQPAE